MYKNLKQITTAYVVIGSDPKGLEPDSIEYIETSREDAETDIKEYALSWLEYRIEVHKIYSNGILWLEESI